MLSRAALLPFGRLTGATASALVLHARVLVRLRRALRPLLEQLVLDHLRVMQVVLVQDTKLLLRMLATGKEVFAVVCIDHWHI